MASSVLLRAAVASTWEEEENSVILTPPHYTSKAASCMSLFLNLVFWLSLLHGVKTLRVAQKTKQLPDQNRRWRPKYYVFPTQYIAFIPALGGRHIIPLNTSWLTWQKQSLNFSWVHLLPAVVASVERCHLGTEKGRRAEPSPPSTANLQFLQPLETFRSSQASPGLANMRGKWRGKRRRAALCAGQSCEAEL